jgi:hypothetical protein
VLILLVLACSGEDEEATPTPTSAPDLAAPSDVRIEGALPDLRTPVPPGQGELGRITVVWKDNSTNEDGFRVFQECNGTPAEVLEVEANVTQYGPLQVCRPGRVGVAAFEGQDQSAIAWSR